MVDSLEQAAQDLADCSSQMIPTTPKVDLLARRMFGKPAGFWKPRFGCLSPFAGSQHLFTVVIKPVMSMMGVEVADALWT